MLIQCPECSSRYNAKMKNSGDVIHCHCGVNFHIPKLPNIARNWNCPSCGGDADPNKSKCEYCDAYLAYARCPSCFSIAPYVDANFCADCGESLILPVRPLPEHNIKKPCPRCNGELNSSVVNSHLVESCHDCGGIWLNHSFFEQLMNNRSISASAVLNLNPSHNKKLDNHEVSYLPCPECDSIMSRHNFMSKSYIILDHCNDHGIWFDKNELAATLEYSRSKNSGNSDTVSRNLLSNRLKNEVFEIKEEDLSLLLEEFPHWIASKE